MGNKNHKKSENKIKNSNSNFKLIKDDKIYDINISKENNAIQIECNKIYYKEFTLKEITSKIGNEFMLLEECFRFLINIFIKNNAFIKEVKDDISITLLFKPDESKEFEIILLSILKTEAKVTLYKKIPSNRIYFDNAFIIFKSEINGILYLIYSNKETTIISYNLYKFNEINKIRNAHNKKIESFRHYFDKLNKRDLMLSISPKDNNIRVWNIYNYECLVNLKNIYNQGEVRSACFLNDKNKIYILSSNYFYSDSDENQKPKPIKVYNLRGEYVESIIETKDNTCFIDIFDDEKSNKKYIITGNRGYSKSYDYKKKKIHQKYSCSNDLCLHISIIINNNGDIIKLIDSCDYRQNTINIWDFNSGSGINSILTGCDNFGLCLLKNKIFIGTKRGMRMIYAEKYLKYIKLEHHDPVNEIRQFIHPELGQCLLVQSFGIEIYLFSFEE